MNENARSQSDTAAFESTCATIADRLAQTYAHVSREELRVRIEDVEITFDPHPDKVILTPFIMDDVFPAVLYTGAAHECARDASIDEFAAAVDSLVEKTRKDWRYTSGEALG